MLVHLPFNKAITTTYSFTLLIIFQKKVWDILGCNSYARIDMIVSDEVPYLLEVNTLPGMTKQSLIPKSAKVRGLEFSELLDKIIEYSLN